VALNSGDMLGGYRVARLLGAGGMGAVYLASHPSLPRFVALKVLSADLSRDPDFRARFQREADVAASLDHPNIVAVYDRGQTPDGQLWIAMQFVDGTDADAALRAGTMTPDRAVHIISQVATALDHAHSRTVVHRDVKPANFLLSGPAGLEERVLLGDFGIARALDDVGLTVTGSVMATVAYAAPEVLAGHAFDGRADIYSLGCTLYRLLTGKPPFPATNGMAAVMLAHLQAPPPRVTAVAPALPPALDEVIAAAMAKNPAARFGSATALGEAARAALYDATVAVRVPLPPVASGDVVSYPHTGGPAPGWWQEPAARTQAAGNPWVPAPPAPRRRGRRAVIGALAAVAVLVAAGVAVIVWPRESTAPAVSAGGPAPSASVTEPVPAGTPASAPSAAPATTVVGPQLRPILLPDSQIAAIAGGSALTLEVDSADLLPDAALSAPQCLGAWSPAQQSVYAGAGVTGVAVQVLRAVGATVIEDSVIQAAVALGSVGQISAFIQGEVQQFRACAAAGAVTVTEPGGPGQMWTFGASTTTAGVVTLTATLDGGAVLCQRGIVARGNVMLDMRQCRPASAGGDVTALLQAASDRVPRE
jgi:hypothetical protein